MFELLLVVVGVGIIGVVVRKAVLEHRADNSPLPPSEGANVGGSSGGHDDIKI